MDLFAKGVCSSGRRGMGGGGGGEREGGGRVEVDILLGWLLLFGPTCGSRRQKRINEGCNCFMTKRL